MAYIPQWPRKEPEQRSVNINEELVALPPQDYLKYRILDHQAAAIREMGRYYYRKSRGITTTTNKVRVALITLYLLIYSSLRRTIGDPETKKLQRKVYSTEFNQLEDAYFIMSDFLDKKKLTLFDSKRSLDYTNLETMNEQNNL